MSLHLLQGRPSIFFTSNVVTNILYCILYTSQIRVTEPVSALYLLDFTTQYQMGCIIKFIPTQEVQIKTEPSRTSSLTALHFLKYT